MPEFPEAMTLKALQEYVKRLEDERGFAQQDVLQKCLLLGEEIGELFKAIRKAKGLRVDPASTHHDVAEELSDILIYVCTIANRQGIDLEEAFKQKEALNSRRRWAPGR